jgi:hypothetical protein
VVVLTKSVRRRSDDYALHLSDAHQRFDNQRFDLPVKYRFGALHYEQGAASTFLTQIEPRLKR